MKKKYVKFRGKTWENTFRTDFFKRMILIDWTDSSKGIVADSDMVYNCTDEEISIIEEILNDREQNSILERI